jgi:hypothetical protein
MNTNNSTVFWVNKPKILFKKNLITEISFNNNMSLEEKLNALTRFIILVSAIGYILLRQTSIILLGATFISLIVLYYFYLKDFNGLKESLTLINLNGEKRNLEVGNPLDNPLTTEFGTKLKQTEAPNNENSKDQITNVAKETVIELNKDNEDSKKLFNDLETNYSFESSLRQFNSIPGSSVPNNQENFLNYCYGKLPSDKNINVY